jgi:hypothetical protein
MSKTDSFSCQCQFYHFKGRYQVGVASLWALATIQGAETLYIYEEDLLWVWRGWGASIITYSMIQVRNQETLLVLMPPPCVKPSIYQCGVASCILMTTSHNGRCWNTSYMYEEDLPWVWVWSGCASIITYIMIQYSEPTWIFTAAIHWDCDHTETVTVRPTILGWGCILKDEVDGMPQSQPATNLLFSLICEEEGIGKWQCCNCNPLNHSLIIVANNITCLMTILLTLSELAMIDKATHFTLCWVVLLIHSFYCICLNLYHSKFISI